MSDIDDILNDHNPKFEGFAELDSPQDVPPEYVPDNFIETEKDDDNMIDNGNSDKVGDFIEMNNGTLNPNLSDIPPFIAAELNTPVKDTPLDMMDTAAMSDNDDNDDILDDQDPRIDNFVELDTPQDVPPKYVPDNFIETGMETNDDDDTLDDQDPRFESFAEVDAPQDIAPEYSAVNLVDTGMEDNDDDILDDQEPRFENFVELDRPQDIPPEYVPDNFIETETDDNNNNIDDIEA
jgi:hypothetical protein